jgi:hypothetical protein
VFSAFNRFPSHSFKRRLSHTTSFLHISPANLSAGLAENLNSTIRKTRNTRCTMKECEGWTISSRIPPKPKGRFFYFGITAEINHNSAQAAYSTWAQRASDGVIWYTTSETQDFPSIMIAHPLYNERKKIFFRVLQIFKHVWAYYPGYDWYINVWDDNYVVPENVENFLKTQNPNSSVVFGLFLKMHFQPFGLVWGGPGRLMSQKSLALVAEHVPECIDFAKGLLNQYPQHRKDWEWAAEDVFLSKFQQDHGANLIMRSGMYPWQPGPEHEKGIACRTKQILGNDKELTPILSVHYVPPSKMIFLDNLWKNKSCVPCTQKQTKHPELKNSRLVLLFFGSSIP